MERRAAVDIARGIAIVAVATFHITQGLVKAGKLEHGFALQFAQNVAYSFHVQLFFLFSGFFLYGRIKSPRALAVRAANLYWPYLVFSAASVAAAMVFASEANVSYTPTQIALIPAVPILHYWFLLDLIAVMVVGYVLSRWLVEVLAVALLAASVSWALGAEWHYYISPLSFSYWLAMFTIGSLIRKYDAVPPVNLAAFAGAVAVALIGAYICTAKHAEIRTAPYLPAALCACYVVFCIATWLARFRVSNVMAYLGAQSLPIYLAHGIFASGARVAVYRPWPGVPVAAAIALILACAIGFPLIAFEAGKRLRLNRVVGFEPVVRAAG